MKIPQDTSNEAKFAMAPMIDMVFLLLVFFMCVSQISTAQNKELQIPDANKSVVPKERPDRFVINITAAGEIFAGNTPMDDLAVLKATVKAHRVAIPATKVYLRADKETEHKHVKKVMGAMAEIGVDDFIFGAFVPN